uniref:Uncharacterized protein n=1 Tax=Anguilla anguilla TaxID=7936 RepID=A0A0E9XH81_ANGAN
MHHSLVFNRKSVSKYQLLFTVMTSTSQYFLMYESGDIYGSVGLILYRLY